MTTETRCTEGGTPRSKLLRGHPVHDPDATLKECARVTQLMRAVRWYDAGEVAWREAKRHDSLALKRQVWMTHN